MSPLKIIYHYISSITVNSNRHQVRAGCLLSRHVHFEHLDAWRWDRLVIQKFWNVITILCCVKSKKGVGPETCSNSVCPSVKRKANGWIYMCFVTLLQKISSRVKSHELPGQGIGPALPNQHPCSRFKSSFIPKNHHTWNFQLQITDK